MTRLCILYCTVPVPKGQSRGDRLKGGQDYQTGQTLTQVQDGGTDDHTELLEEPQRYRCSNAIMNAVLGSHRIMSSVCLFSLSDIQSLLTEEGELQLNLPTFLIKPSDTTQVSNYLIYNGNAKVMLF